LKDLCHAALLFCLDVLETGGHFVCKFYQGAEDKQLQAKLEKVFAKVVREKPESSRKVCALYSRACMHVNSIRRTRRRTISLR
jgi:21S rRNA (uridine2791-2'-O)-methyltransferase